MSPARVSSPSDDDWMAASDALLNRWAKTLFMDRSKGEVPLRMDDSEYTRPDYVPKRATVFGNVLDVNIGKDANAQGMFKMFRDETISRGCLG